MNPVALDKDGVDATMVEREIEVGKEQTRGEAIFKSKPSKGSKPLEGCNQLPAPIHTT